MNPTRSALLLTAMIVAGGSPALAADPIDDVLATLNKTPSVAGKPENKSYPTIFAAYLELGPSPIEISTEFNNTVVHPGMAKWALVSGWAEDNPALADAIIACEGKTLLGLPYGRDEVESRFREASLVADIGVNGSLRDNRFPWLDAVDTIATYATAEVYRRLESGRVEEGLDLALAHIFFLRQCCDREFLDEQLYAISLLIEVLENFRDQLYLYRDRISVEQYSEIGVRKLPFLRPDRSRLLLPEGDRVVSSALIGEVFDDRGQADRERFAATFASIQSREKPLTRFGAARRWRMVAEVHDAEQPSQERLQLIYDDWWRRWRIEEYDQILDIDSQFARTNPVRFAAVIYSMQNIEDLFDVRNELIAAVNGTAMATGLCGYFKRYGTYPSSSDKMYAQFVRKRSDRDPFDTQFLPFEYRVLDSRLPIDTEVERVFVERGECILYSKGRDHQDGRANVHTEDGSAGDLVFWPPTKAVLRQQGALD